MSEASVPLVSAVLCSGYYLHQWSLYWVIICVQFLVDQWGMRPYWPWLGFYFYWRESNRPFTFSLAGGIGEQPEVEIDWVAIYTIRECQSAGVGQQLLTSKGKGLPCDSCNILLQACPSPLRPSSVQLLNPCAEQIGEKKEEIRSQVRGPRVEWSPCVLFRHSPSIGQRLQQIRGVMEGKCNPQLPGIVADSRFTSWRNLGLSSQVPWLYSIL